MDLYNGLFNALNNGEGGGSQPAKYGRFLSLWNCSTGLPRTNPDQSPYEYITGDYFIVDVVAEEGNNYRPDGTSFIIGQASTVIETKEVSIGDTYWFDGENWLLQINHQVAPGIVWEVVWNESNEELASGPTYEEIITIRDNSLSGTRLALHVINENGDLIGEFEYQGVTVSANYRPDDDYPIFFLNVSVPSMLLYFQVFKINAADAWTFISRDSGEGVAEAWHADLANQASSANSANSANNASYAAKIGTSSTHPAIGSDNRPVHVDVNGNVVVGNYIPKVTEWEVKAFASSGEITGTPPTFEQISTAINGATNSDDIFRIKLLYQNNAGSVTVGSCIVNYDSTMSVSTYITFIGLLSNSSGIKLVSVKVTNSNVWTITPYVTTNNGEMVAAKLGYNNVGGEGSPIYLDSGTPKQCKQDIVHILYKNSDDFFTIPGTDLDIFIQLPTAKETSVALSTANWTLESDGSYSQELDISDPNQEWDPSTNEIMVSPALPTTKNDRKAYYDAMVCCSSWAYDSANHRTHFTFVSDGASMPNKELTFKIVRMV